MAVWPPDQALLMLRDTAFQIVGMADVERPIAAPKKVSMESHAQSQCWWASFDNLRTNGASGNCKFRP
jgi:hypothetical protein